METPACTDFHTASMPLHDRYLRATPYERIFPDPETRDRILDRIGREVEERGLGDEDPGAFALLARTREALAELRDPAAEDDGGHTHAILLFHAHHLRKAGAPHLLASVPVSRWAVEGRSEGDDGEDRDGFPASVYVQLPQHLFWVREDAEERPHSLDGFFWTVAGPSLHLLGVVGFQAGSTGVRVLPFPAVPLAERPVWQRSAMREDGEDFRSEIPGSDMEGLYEVRTFGELLKLAARLDQYLARFPDALRECPEPSAEDEPAAPPPGAGPYGRLELH